jgi:hypothetical protein
MKSRVIAWVAAPLLLASLLAGCSTDSATTEQTTDDPSTGEIAGGDPSTWAPIEISTADNGKNLLMVPNQRAIFTDLPADDANNAITLETSDPVAVEVIQREETEDSVSVPGLIAVSAGEATITVFDGFPADGDAEVVMTVNITVADQ